MLGEFLWPVAIEAAEGAVEDHIPVARRYRSQLSTNLSCYLTKLPCALAPRFTVPIQLPGPVWPVLIGAVRGAPHFAFNLAMFLPHVPGQSGLPPVLEGAHGALEGCLLLEGYY